MTEAAYNTIVKDNPLPIYKRVPEKDMSEGVDDLCSSFQVTISQKDVSDITQNIRWLSWITQRLTSF